MESNESPELSELTQESEDRGNDDLIAMILADSSGDQYSTPHDGVASAGLTGLDPEQIKEYVISLCEQNVPALVQEPGRLSASRSAIVDRTQQLALKNYQTYLETDKHVKGVGSQLRGIESLLTSVASGAFPNFVQVSSNLLTHANQMSSQWHETGLMIKKHGPILEFIEIPQLMDTCVRNGHYEEALRLYKYVHRLWERHAATIPLLEEIGREADDCRGFMISTLLRDLQQPVLSLQAAIGIISLLRQMDDTFTEVDLRLKFLSSRDHWLETQLRGLPWDNPLVHLSKVIEVNRNGIFDIITQYRAIFSEEDLISSRKYNINLGIKSKTDVSELFEDERGRGWYFNSCALLHSWVNYRVREFLATLTFDIKKSTETTADEELSEKSLIERGNVVTNLPVECIIEPCYRFGQAMNRIGADFRPQLTIIFNRILPKKYQRIVLDAAAGEIKNQKDRDEIWRKFSQPDSKRDVTNIQNDKVSPDEGGQAEVSQSDLTSQNVVDFGNDNSQVSVQPLGDSGDRISPVGSTVDPAAGSSHSPVDLTVPLLGSDSKDDSLVEQQPELDLTGEQGKISKEIWP